MPNYIEYPNLIMKALDLQLVQQATSGWMQNNSKQVKFTGGRTVKIPKLTLTGLGNYNRDNGTYPKGVITTAYESMELKMDRAAQFYFDRNDVDETNYLLEAGSIMNQFQKEHVIPEIDAYRYAKIAATAIDKGVSRTYTPAKEHILSNLVQDLRAVQDKTGVDLREMVISMPYTAFELLEMSGELNRQFSTQNFEQGGINMEIISINGAAVIPVPSVRMKSKYTFATGTTGFGFSAAAGALDINWIIAPRSLPIAVAKTDSMKIFGPDVNQDGDGWKTQYRVYHDLFVPDALVNGIFVNTK